MDVLIPTRYDGPMEQGGSTKPWKVFAITDISEEEPIEHPYVVKIFSPPTVLQHPCIAKEFICNLLAKEFDLLVPEAGIINLHNKEFLNTLSKKDLSILKSRHQGATYASKLLNGILVKEDIRNTFTDIDDRALIYAFDCFIMNMDRWGFHKKPNLLFYNENFLLIDHELSLPFIDKNSKEYFKSILTNIDNYRFVYNFEKHLFYSSLKNYADSKEKLFDTFHEYLIGLNIAKVYKLINVLKIHDIDVASINHLFDYINEIKMRSVKFCEILLKTII